MNGTKPWYESAGVWGGIVAMLAGMIGVGHYTLSADDQRLLAEALAGIGSGLGGIVSIYGRVKASKAIGAVLIFFAVLLFMPAASVAADMPKAAPAPKAVQAPWSGFYFGGIGAGAKTAGDFALLEIPGNGNLRPSGFMAGGLVGVGGWTGNLFVGLEADASYDFSKAEQACGFAETVIGCELKSGWLFTQRVVLGAQMSSLTGAVRRAAPAKVTQWRDSLSVSDSFATSAIMPYVTAGIAERRVAACVTEQGCARQWIVGPAVGGGVRVPVSSGFSLGVEYLYVKYDKSFTPAGGPALFAAEFKAVSEHLGRISLTGHF